MRHEISNVFSGQTYSRSDCCPKGKTHEIPTLMGMQLRWIWRESFHFYRHLNKNTKELLNTPVSGHWWVEYLCVHVLLHFFGIPPLSPIQLRIARQLLVGD